MALWSLFMFHSLHLFLELTFHLVMCSGQRMKSIIDLETPPGPSVTVPPLGLLESVDRCHFVFQHETDQASCARAFSVTRPFANELRGAALLDPRIHVPPYDD